MAPKGRKSASRGYVLSIGLVAVFLGCAWYAAGVYSNRAYAAFATRDRELQIDLARAAMQSSFQQILRESAILASYSFAEYERGMRSLASMKALLDAELSTYTEELVYIYFDADGPPLLPQGAHPSAALAASLERQSREMWKVLAGREGPYVIPGPDADPEPYFMVFHPVRVDGRLRGVLGLAVGFSQSITKYVYPLRNEKGRNVYLLAADGRVLWPAGAKAPQAGGFSLPTGATVTSRAFLLGNESFALMATDNGRAFRGELAEVDRIRAIITILGTIIGVAAVYGIIRLYYAETRRNSLAEQEELLRESVRRREEELRESELMFEAVFEGAFDAILVLDGAGTILRCNRRAVESLDQDGAGILGSRLSVLSPGVQANGQSSAEAEAQQLARAISGEYPRFEWAHRRADGVTAHFEAGLACLRSREGCFVVAILRDITERKREETELRMALEDRELLFGELHHRVRNNLQLMDSLIELQKGYEVPAAAAALSKVQSRLDALAVSYLITSDSPGALRVDSQRYLGLVCSLCREEAVSRGVRLTTNLEAESFLLPLDAAVPLGLVLRELILNAATHGYGTGGSGTVEISFIRKGSRAELRVADNGRGMAEAAREGLGLTLVRALVAQLGGDFRFEGGSGWAAANASFPMV
jgi:PAS domain S-box-containing protein